MITKNDLLVVLSQQGTKDAYDTATDLVKGKISIADAARLLHSDKSLDVANFYEKLRASHNNKKSKLYINIMKSDENLINDANTVVTTLSALLNQIFQFEASNKTMFLRHARAEEIVRALHQYCTEYNIDECINLLRYFKSDIKVMLNKNE